MGTDHATQVTRKERACADLLAPFGPLRWEPTVTGPEAGFRNKAKMVVGGTIENPTLGILDRERRGVDLRGCGILQPDIRACLPAISSFISRARLRPYDVPNRSGELKYVLVSVTPDGAVMLRFVLRSQEAIARIRKHLPLLRDGLPQLNVVSANIQPEHKAIIEGDLEIPLSDARTLTMPLGMIHLHLGAKSFFQTNTHIAQTMYAQARAWCDEFAPSTVWDLYCGVGGFALHCADGTRTVTGVEVSREAIESARRSADEAALANVDFIAGDAEQFAISSHRAPELAIVNPPRRGIGSALADWFERSTTETVIYSSCNAKTLAADLERMPSFTLARARLLDMFPQTDHYETMALLRRS